MIFVFKTFVKTKIQIKKLNPNIEKILLNAKGNFDLEDTDKILRIDSEENIVLKIIDLLSIHKFYYEEVGLLQTPQLHLSPLRSLVQQGIQTVSS